MTFQKSKRKAKTKTKTEQVGKVFLGIDPGKSGGLACVSQGGTLIDYTPMPTTEYDIWKWISAKQGVSDCMIEKVHAMPGQGVTSMFTFGHGYGGLRMALIAAQIPFDETSPRGWQKELAVAVRKKTESKQQFKDRLRQKATQLFPREELWNRTLGEQRSVCDAILIAEFCRRKNK